MNVTLPPLPDRSVIADLSREAAAKHHVQPAQVEKDFFLTRLLWALGQALGDQALLKGGTLLSKVDLGFFRMSEDADLVVAGTASRSGGANARKTNTVRNALKQLAPLVGVRLPYPTGERFARSAHVIWELPYDSEFGSQRLLVEASVRPVLRPGRQVMLAQLLQDPLVGDHSRASCWALDATEARAEKVRAAFTREAIRDFYDLDRLLASGADFTSPEFLELVTAKLAEMKRPAFAEQPPSFALDAERRRRLEASWSLQLPAVLRSDAPAFDLDEMVARFDHLWGKPLSTPGLRRPR